MCPYIAWLYLKIAYVSYRDQIENSICENGRKEVWGLIFVYCRERRYQGYEPGRNEQFIQFDVVMHVRKLT